MSTKKELEDKVAALERELGAVVGGGARALDAAQAAMVSSRAVGEANRMATRESNLKRRAEQQRVVGVELAVVEEPAEEPAEEG